MKKNFTYFLIVGAVAVLVVTWLLVWGNGADGLEEPVVKRLEDLKEFGSSSEQNVLSVSDSADAVAALEESIQFEYRKCFRRNTSAQSLDAMKALLLKQRDFSNPSTIHENYELITSDQRKMVVQHVPMDDSLNQVRVFEINPTDGTPNRIQDFSRPSADVSLRLKDALDLGTVQTKTVATTQNAYDGALLTFDEINGKLARLHLITSDFDFECKEQSCLCLKKE